MAWPRMVSNGNGRNRVDWRDIREAEVIELNFWVEEGKGEEKVKIFSYQRFGKVGR